MEGKMSKKKVIKSRGGQLVVRHRVETAESEKAPLSPRLRGESKSPTNPKPRGRGRSFHLDLERGDD